MRRAKWLSAAAAAAKRVDARIWLAATIRAVGGEARALGATQLDSSVKQLLGPLIEAVRADPVCLGDAYAAVTRTEGRPTGRYYTPPSVVTAILDRIPSEARILDPACGGGRFLLASNRVGVGYDVDPVAVALAQDLVALAGRTVQIEHRDALADFAADRLPWGTFDAVVGNPPYRGGHRGLAQNTALYRRRFITAEYQLDPYILFIELSLKMLREGGYLALVIPNAWISNLRTSKLRAHLAEYTVDAVVELPIDTFDAKVETVVLHLRKMASVDAQIPIEGTRGGYLYIPANPSAPWPLARTAQAEAILKAAHRCTLTLGDVAEITRGINPYHHTTHTPDQIAARVHHSDHTQGPDWVPELRGRHLDAYRLWWGGAHWIHYGPWLKEPRAPRFFEGPRLVVRKILGATLCAAYLDTPLCCDQSVYIARLTEPRWPPGALLAILNSHFMAELVRTRHQEDDQVFPQLKVTELRWLPLPPVDPAGLTKLGQDALKLQMLEARRFALLDAELAIEDPRDRGVARGRALRAGWRDPGVDARKALRAQIECVITGLYGLC